MKSIRSIISDKKLLSRVATLVAVLPVIIWAPVPSYPVIAAGITIGIPLEVSR